MVDFDFMLLMDILIWNPTAFFSDVDLWQTVQKLIWFKYKKYYHIFIRVLHSITKLMSGIFEDQGEGGIIVEQPDIWYIWKAPNVLFTGHPDFTLWHI